MIPGMGSSRWLLVPILLSALAGGTTSVLAQGACCAPDDSCQPAADDAECSGLGGVFLDGEDCATDPCVPAACCDGVNCGILGAHACITSGRSYAGAGVTCLDDPCQANIGVCCNNGSCSEQSPDDCSTGGGVWLGAGTFCSQGLCDLGSCCRPGLCEDGALYECNAVQGSFQPGGDCINDPVPCDVQGDCPLNSLASQSPDGPNAFTAYTSEAAAGFQRWDDYSGAVGPIDSLRWWGFDMDLVAGEFVECVESNNSFAISFHEDQAGLPGAAVCSYTLTASSTVVPEDYNGAAAPL